MTLTKEKELTHIEYQKFNKSFIEDSGDIEIGFDTFLKKTIEINTYENTSFPPGYNMLINRLDEIELLIKTKVAHKSDIQKSKEEIISEQKKQINESKELIKRLLIVLNKKSTPNIFSAISLAGLLISSAFLLYSVFFNVVIFTKFHFIISTLGFFLMFIMARLSLKLLHDGDN